MAHWMPSEVTLTIHAPKTLLYGTGRIEVKASVNLTWIELLRGQNIRIDSGAFMHNVEYKPTNPKTVGRCGWRAELNEQIREYISKFTKRKGAYHVCLFSPQLRAGSNRKVRTNENPGIRQLTNAREGEHPFGFTYCFATGQMSLATNGQRVETPGPSSTPQLMLRGQDAEEAGGVLSNQQEESVVSNSDPRDRNESDDSGSDDGSEMMEVASLSAQTTAEGNELQMDGISVDHKLKGCAMRNFERFGNDMLTRVFKEIRKQKRSHGWDRNAIRNPLACYFLQELFNEATMTGNRENVMLLNPLVRQRLLRFSNGMLTQIRNEIQRVKEDNLWDRTVNRTPLACYLLEELLAK